LLSADQLTERLGLPTYVANDADAAAVGEAAFGAGVGSADVAYLTVSTGIGAGIVNGGRLVRGRRSVGEVGHTVIDWLAWRAGEPSTLEQLGSGSGVARVAGEAGLGEVDARAVQDAAAAGDARAVAIWEGAVAACAAGVCNLIMAFSPSTVVIGGGLGSQQEFFGPLRARVLAHSEHHPADLTVLPSGLGDDAGLAGAAAWLAAAGAAG
jgi:predicted NBD/HSP70 family sugar kinase